MDKYDAVVVGAGNAGLSAAMNLVLHGKRVLIIEQHNTAGGCATSFVRGRFEFDPSLHELCDVGSQLNPGSVRKLFDEYGVDIDWIEIKDCFRVIGTFSDGTPMDVTMPTGVIKFIDRMEEYVPGSRKKMIRLFDLADEIRRGTDYLTSHHGSYSILKLLKDYPNMMKVGSYPTLTVFNRLEIPAKCQDILSTYWSYLGVDLSRISFLHYMLMFTNYISRSPFIPKGTSHTLSTKLVSAFLDKGGEIWYGCRAEKFLFEGNRCVGVETTQGPVYSDVVLANINGNTVYGKMVDRNLLPERLLKLLSVRKNKNSGRLISIYLGLDRTAEELGIHDYSIFIRGNSDSRIEYSAIEKCLDDNDFCIFLCYNVADPTFSPLGTAVCSITAFASMEDYKRLEEKDYPKLKNRIAKKYLKLLKEKTGINLFDHIEEIEVATPITFAHYIGTPEGSVYGHDCGDWDGVFARSMDQDKDYPLPGLFPIGADGPTGDGYGVCYVNGKTFADRAISYLEELK